MKSITLITLLAAGSVMAGDKNPVFDKNPVIPPAPSLYSWFAGATVGYLIENEEEMYTGHIGVDLPNQLGGWDQAIYLEIGYFELDGCINITSGGYNSSTAYSQFENTVLEYGDGNGYGYGRACFDIEVIPLTLNYKLEKQVSQSLNAYFGIGAGVAFIDAEVQAGVMKDSDDDTVFYAQVFGGILYNVNPTFEIFAGARVIYFDEPDFTLFGTSIDLDDIDDAGYEVHNTDVLLEVGGRINF